MQDGEAFETALRQETSYISTLASSLGLVLDEFYKNIKSVGCSAVSGLGCEEFITAVQLARVEYETVYRPEYEQMLKEENERIEEERKNLLKKNTSGEPLLGDVNNVPEKEPGSEILIRPSYGLDLEEPDSEEEDAGADEQEQNNDECKEYDSFKAFLAREKENRGKKLISDNPTQMERK